jgi:hypothetical protein
MSRIDDYRLESSMFGQNDWSMTSGRTKLFYLPKYFKKVERESKAEQIRGRKRQFNSTGPTFLWMTPVNSVDLTPMLEMIPKFPD